MEQQQSIWNDSLVIETDLPLRWSPLTGAFDKDQHHASNRHALELFQSLEENTTKATDPGSVQGSIPGSVNHDVVRVEAKLDLLLDMVGQLLQKQTDLPESVPLQLSAFGVTWLSDTGPKLHDEVLVELYLDMNYPKPVCLAGCVKDVQDVKEGQWIQVSFAPLAEDVASQLEKWIFKWHRRAIAQAKVR